MIYKFNITGFNLTVIDQGTKWVIRDISWVYTGKNPNGVYASVAGTTPLEHDPNQPNFVPVEQVTKDLLTQWLFDRLDPEFLRHVKDSIDGTVLRNARIVNNEQQMTTWLPMAVPGDGEIDQEVLNAYLSR
jgi:hypothetical protein